MIKRSVNWIMYEAIMLAGYSEAFTRDLVMVMSASIWDLAEPTTYAPHLVSDPLPGTPAHRVLLQIGLGDAQVPNLSAYMQVRTAGIPLMLPSPVEPFGVETVADGELSESGLVIYAIPGVTPAPPGTRSPGGNNDAHEGVRRAVEAQEQIRRFTAIDGMVEQTCDGPCDPD